MNAQEAEEPPFANHPDLRERTYQLLKDEIMTGKLPAGSRLVTVELAARLGVSRTPVAAAVSRLQSEGFVMERPRRGYFVTSLDLEALAERMDASTMIQRAAVEAGIYQASEEEIERLRRVLGEIERLASGSDDDIDPERLLRLDHEFHLATLASARNRYLTEMYDALMGHHVVFRAGVRRQDRRQIVFMLQEFREVAVAFENRDPDAAIASIVRHQERVKARMLAAIQERDARVPAERVAEMVP